MSIFPCIFIQNIIILYETINATKYTYVIIQNSFRKGEGYMCSIYGFIKITVFFMKKNGAIDIKTLYGFIQNHTILYEK